MDLFRQIEIIQRLNGFIEKERTGKPEEFSRKLGISRSQLYRPIEFLKDHDAPIVYSRTLETFHYSRPFQIKINFELEDLTQQQVTDINGGELISRKFLSIQFLGQETLNLGLTK